MIENFFMRNLKLKIDGDSLIVGKYRFPIGKDIKVTDEEGKIMLIGKVNLKIYEDAEAYIDYYHCGFIIEIKGNCVYDNRFGPKITITLADLVFDAYDKNWEIKEV